MPRHIFPRHAVKNELLLFLYQLGVHREVGGHASHHPEKR